MGIDKKKNKCSETGKVKKETKLGWNEEEWDGLQVR